MGPFAVVFLSSRSVIYRGKKVQLVQISGLWLSRFVASDHDEEEVVFQEQEMPFS